LVGQSAAESQRSVSLLPIRRLETDVARLFVTASASQQRIDQEIALLRAQLPARAPPSSSPRLANVFLLVDSLPIRTIQVDLGKSVMDLKKRISEIFGFAVETQGLVHGARPLRNDISLHDYGISEDTTLELKI
jgi:hypothetical protein